MKSNFENDIDIFSTLFELQEDEKFKHSHIKMVPPLDVLNKYNSTIVNNDVDDYVSSKYKLDYDIKVPKHEIDSLLINIADKLNESKYDELINECKNIVISSIVGPFGLGKVFNTDKDGGNVTTTHNFEQQAKLIREGKLDKKIVATIHDFENAHIYVDRVDNFNNGGRKKYEKGNFKEKREELQNKEVLRDAYTGKILGKKLDKNGQLKNEFDLDHVVSAKEINSDAKNYLFMNESQRCNMAVDDKNLKPTDPGLNRSKNDRQLKEWEKTENKFGIKNAEKYDIDESKTSKIDKEARNYIKKTQLENQIKKQGKEIVSTGSNQALRQGASQAIGLILSEFSEAIFFEIKDIMKYGFKNGKLDEKFISVLKFRLNRIKDRVLEKWKYAVVTFKEGAISGFLSNLATTIINSFITTSKRLVRIIREGFGSLCKAFKLLLNPPQDMTKEDALHESSKLFATGIVLSGGILLEETISKYMGNIPFGDKITAVIMGIITGLTTIVVVYMIDKLDLLGVNRKKLLDNTSNELDFILEENIKQLEVLVF